MTIAFDAIWIPIVISALGFTWATWISFQGSWAIDPFFTASVALALPAVPVLSAWLVWALLT